MVVCKLSAWRDVSMLLVWLTRDAAFAHIAATVDRGTLEEVAEAEAVQAAG